MAPTAPAQPPAVGQLSSRRSSLLIPGVQRLHHSAVGWVLPRPPWLSDALLILSLACAQVELSGVPHFYEAFLLGQGHPEALYLNHLPIGPVSKCVTVQSLEPTKAENGQQLYVLLRPPPQGL